MTHPIITAEEARTLSQTLYEAVEDPYRLIGMFRGEILAAAGFLKALHAEAERLRAQNGELRSALQDYIDSDDTNEGGKWEESNAPWLAIKRRAAALLSEPTP